MPPLTSGSCDTCSAEGTELHTNPFTKKEQCQECRDGAIIGVSGAKSQYKLSDADLKGLEMALEPQLKGADRKFYLLAEVEKKGEEVAEKKEAARQEKEAAKEKKETAKKEKEDGKKNKSAKPTAKDTKRKRGPEVTEKEVEDEEEESVSAPEPAAEATPPAKRGRGRPPKAGGAAKKVPAAGDGGKPKRGRGRPPKAK